MLRQVVYTLSLLVVLIGTTGCAVAARTPWGNVDLKGGSGNPCSPVAAPESRSPKVERRVPLAPPVAPVRPLSDVGDADCVT